MINKIYVVYDSAAKIFNKPFFMINDESAIRSIKVAAQEETTIARFPEDYTLFRLGDYDDENAQVNLATAPIRIGSVLELIKDDKSEQPVLRSSAS